MTRLNWSSRESPTDLDTPPDDPSAARNLQFDYTSRGGASPWPERHKFSRVKFGPALIRAAWKAGLVVVAYVDGFDHPVAVTESRWNAAKCFEVRSQGIWYLPKRIKTAKMSQALKSTGEYIEDDAT